MNEIWKDIYGYDGVYQISNLGNIKSLDHLVIQSNGMKRIQRGRILSKSKSIKGYLRVSLSKLKKNKHFFIHRLVMITFKNISDSNNKQVNHINGIKDDNRVENLEWCTNRENIIHAYKNNLIKSNKGEKHHNI